MTRIQADVTNKVCIATGLTAFVLLYTGLAGNANPQNEVTTTHYTSETSSSVSLTSATECVVDPEVKKWLRFKGLADEWRGQSAALSSITAMSMLPSYQSIIGMGEDAIPLILAELKSEGDEPDQWFWALKAITGADPINPGAQGDYRKMAQAWFRWAEDEGYAG